MNIALILAGGSGSRLGSMIPKQYIEVGGKPIISYSLKTFEQHKWIDGIQVVAEKRWHSRIRNMISQKLKGFTCPGETRQLSILNGLKDIRRYAYGRDLVIIHDAARPMLQASQITACLDAVERSGETAFCEQEHCGVAKQYEGAVPVLPMKDTVYLSSDGRAITSLLERSHVFAGQAPECFVLERYYEANKRLLPERILQINGSAEPAVLAGMDIALVPGDEANFKITTDNDLRLFRQIIERGTE